MCIGAILSTILNIYTEKIAKHYNKLTSTPEDRLYFTCIESALSPIGMFWFGKIFDMRFLFLFWISNAHIFLKFRLVIIPRKSLDHSNPRDRL